MIAMMETRVLRLDVTDVTLPSLRSTWARISLLFSILELLAAEHFTFVITRPAFIISFAFISKKHSEHQNCFFLENYKSLPRESFNL